MLEQKQCQLGSLNGQLQRISGMQFETLNRSN